MEFQSPLVVVVDNVNCAILKKAIINFSWRPFFTIRYFPTLGCAKWSKIHHVIIYLFILVISREHGRRKVHDYFLLLLCKSSIWFTEKHIFKIIIYFFNTLTSLIKGQALINGQDRKSPLPSVLAGRVEFSIYYMKIRGQAGLFS